MRLDRPTGAKCEETTGFLFKHECFKRATCKCDSCGRQTCDEHSVTPDPAQPATLCLACAKRADGGQRAAYRQYRGDYDPYWYSDWHYHGYNYYGPGYWGNSYTTSLAADSGDGGSSAGSDFGPASVRDPNDFAESDAASVRAEGDLGGFEVETHGS